MSSTKSPATSRRGAQTSEKTERHMRRASPRRPAVGALSLPSLTVGDPELLEPEASRECERFEGIDLTGRSLAGLRLEECELADLSLHDADLRGARFVEVRLLRVSAPSLRSPRSSWRDVCIENSRIGSAELSGSSWQSVRFVGCKLSYLNLRDADLSDVEFVDCTVEELDIGSARVARIAFSSSSVQTLSVELAQLEDVDLRGADIGTYRGLENLRGATVTPRQFAALAPQLAQHLGIAIQD